MVAIDQPWRLGLCGGQGYSFVNLKSLMFERSLLEGRAWGHTAVLLWEGPGHALKGGKVEHSPKTRCQDTMSFLRCCGKWLAWGRAGRLAKLG